MFVILSGISHPYFNVRLVQYDNSKDALQPVLLLWGYYTVSHIPSVMLIFCCYNYFNAGQSQALEYHWLVNIQEVT